MKKLTRDGMKKVMGGIKQQSGCYAKCCFHTDADWCNAHNYAVGMFPVASCTGANACVGGAMMGCTCYGGPYN